MYETGSVDDQNTRNGINRYDLNSESEISSVFPSLSHRIDGIFRFSAPSNRSSQIVLKCADSPLPFSTRRFMWQIWPTIHIVVADKEKVSRIDRKDLISPHMRW
jgi:hypothetical protein